MSVGAQQGDFGPWSETRVAAGLAASAAVLVVGGAPAAVWGLTPTERTRRIAARRGLSLVAEAAADAAMIVVNGRYVFDPLLFDWVAAAAGRMVTWKGALLLAHAEPGQARAVAMAIDEETPLAAGQFAQFERLDASSGVFNRELFKTAPPFVARASPQERRNAERICFDGAYRGVTDLFTAHVFKPAAFWIMGLCVRLGLTPNMVTGAGFGFCVAAAALFWRGALWAGLACALAFMVLDIVDGKLARCTIRSSRFGDLFDHGVDVLHPPFWWLAWSHGAGLLDGQSAVLANRAAAILVLVYLLQRAIEAAFLWRWGMQIHLWRRFDSRFRLITAQRNIHIAILSVSMVFAAPAAGLAAAAGWSVASAAIHAVRAALAFRLHWRGGAVTSWLGAPPSAA